MTTSLFSYTDPDGDTVELLGREPNRSALKTGVAISFAGSQGSNEVTYLDFEATARARDVLTGWLGGDDPQEVKIRDLLVERGLLTEERGTQQAEIDRLTAEVDRLTEERDYARADLADRLSDSPLDLIQRQRQEALVHARTLIEHRDSTGAFGKAGSRIDSIFDLVDVARFIVTGTHPFDSLPDADEDTDDDTDDPGTDYNVRTLGPGMEKEEQ